MGDLSPACFLAFLLVPSTFAMRKPALAQILFLAGLGVMNGLCVSAAARLDFWHRGSVSRGVDDPTSA